IIAGLIPQSDGEVWLDDERIDHLPPERRGFGMVFQNYALFPHLTVFGNIAFGLQLQRRSEPEIREAVRAMLDLVQLPGLEERYPRRVHPRRSTTGRRASSWPTSWGSGTSSPWRSRPSTPTGLRERARACA